MLKYVGYIVLCFFIICVGCLYNEADYIESELIPETFIDVEFFSDSVEADGESSTIVLVKLPANTKSKYDTVRLTVSNGKFPNGNSTITLKAFNISNDNLDLKEVNTKLISSQKPGLSVITTQVANYQLIDTIHFIKAFPKYIQTILPSLTIGYGYNTIPVVTKLIRETGFPSENTLITIVAVDSIGNEIGLFLNKTERADLMGTITNNYSLGIDSSCNCKQIFFITSTEIRPTKFKVDTTSIIIK